MRRPLTTLLALMIACTTAPYATASNFTGNDALRGCVDMLSAAENPRAAGSFSDGLTAGYCVGLMEGARFVADITEFLQVNKLICVPAHLNDMQVVSETTTYLQNHPELINKSAPSTLVAALTKRFPCN